MLPTEEFHHKLTLLLFEWFQPHLNVLQPWFEGVQSSLAIFHIPDQQVQRPICQEALVSCIVLLLVLEEVTMIIEVMTIIRITL